MAFQEEDLSIYNQRRTHLLNSLRATSFSGRQITVPKYDYMPPYFERTPEYNVTWNENPPLDDIVLKESNAKSFIEKYSAKSYSDLLSDEKANREVLNWLRQFKQPGKKKKEKEFRKRSSRKREAAAAAAEDGKSKKFSHILILSGPSGCGKSTLIRVASEIYHYHIIELNASEDTKNERNQILLQNQLDFEPVFGKKTSPLLVLEEMDGSGTITDSVIKAVMNLHGKPVIVVVNNLYAPGLRTLRSQADVVKMEAPTSSKFITRLRKIADMEGIQYIPKAIVDIAEQSRFDMRTALNTLQFLSIRQPVTPEMVQLMPVGVKNATFTYFDIITQIFSMSSKLEDTLLSLESFGDNNLIAAGILENLENIKATGPAGRRIADVLDNLSFADTAYGEIAELGFACVPKLVGISHVNRQLNYPTDSLTRENTFKKNQKLLIGKIKQYTQLLSGYMDPDQQVLNALGMRGNDKLRNDFVSFHKAINVTYKKGLTGYYTSEPDIDSLLVYNRTFNYNNNYVVTGKLSKFRELIQREIEKDTVKVTKELLSTTSGYRIEDKLKKNRSNPKSTIARDFWGNKIEIGLSQLSVDKRPSMYYRYNEGFTNAVRRVVMLERILEPK
ncbi:ATPase, AAA family protein [Tritrichomonas foetus]|uniref:ATPase, AAA family protein n=1 Tax=Tritrichomonas foetus TaxID=1144522 RepID=A0A1J4JC39_9EUKA|nr:ATPase, AAA family protein [Tritrichomonas foetus]|eukprot:OHS96770.1 ATPase, AAA family protein [Tritrichomonas foetus]